MREHGIILRCNYRRCVHDYCTVKAETSDTLLYLFVCETRFGIKKKREKASVCSTFKAYREKKLCIIMVRATKRILR